jgi:hypothetical protein
MNWHHHTFLHAWHHHYRMNWCQFRYHVSR